nr:hypothetical protein [uncultured Undibacterium sp.]
MAAWQFVVDLIPNSWVAEGGNGNVLKKDFVDTSPAWSDCSIRLDDVIHSISFVEKTLSWDPNLTIWGDLEKTDIQIWAENGSIDSIQIRLDLREGFLNLVNEIFALSRRIGCSVLVRENLVFVENEDELLSAIKTSRAAIFVHEQSSVMS